MKTKKTLLSFDNKAATTKLQYEQLKFFLLSILMIDLDLSPFSYCLLFLILI